MTLSPQEHYYIAEALERHMSAISEKHYCAGWLSNLEYSLWKIWDAPNKEFGFESVSEEDCQALKSLHEMCDGWWFWCDSTKRCEFVTTSDWEQMYKEFEEKNGTDTRGIG